MNEDLLENIKVWKKQFGTDPTPLEYENIKKWVDEKNE
jgi:hypothetical protein